MDVGSIMTGVANMANTVVQPVSTKRQQERNQKYAEKNARLQQQLNEESSLRLMNEQNKINNANYEKQRDDAYSREDYLMANSKRIETQALRDAGINPAWAQGGSQGIPATPMASLDGVSPTSGSASVSPVNYQAPMTGVNLASGIEGFVAMKNAIADLKQKEANTELTKETAKSKALENKATQEENDISSFVHLEGLRIDPETGSLYDMYEPNREIHYSSTPTTRKGWQALGDFDALLENSSQKHSRTSQGILDTLVSSLQIKDKDVLDALANLPDKTIKKCIAETDKIELENELQSASKFFWKHLEENPNKTNDVIKFLASAFLTLRK